MAQTFIAVNYRGDEALLSQLMDAAGSLPGVTPIGGTGEVATFSVSDESMAQAAVEQIQSMLEIPQTDIAVVDSRTIRSNRASFGV